MKKYLITGAMALLAGFYLTSCTHDDVGNQGVYEEKTQTFEKVFHDLYGDIAPDHDWGFKSLNSIAIANSRAAAGTRVVGTRGENANANEWADVTNSTGHGGWKVPPALTEGQKLRVKAYFQANPNLDYNDPHLRNFFVQQVYKGGSGCETTTEKVIAAGGQVYTSDKMNHMTVGQSNVHINNFNHGDATELNVLDNGANLQTHTGQTYHSDKIMLMVDINDTSCFGYHESGSSNEEGSVNHNDRMALVSASIIDTWAAANGNIGEAVFSEEWNRSFLGFDLAIKEGSQIWSGETQTLSSDIFMNFQYVKEGNTITRIQEYEDETHANNNYNIRFINGADILLGTDNEPLKKLISNTNFFSGDLVTLNESELKENIAFNDDNEYFGKGNKDVLKLDKVKEMINAGYYPVSGSALKTWVKPKHSYDGYFSDWIVTLTQAVTVGNTEEIEGPDNPGNNPGETVTETSTGDEHKLLAIGRIFVEDLYKATREDLDFNDAVFDAAIWQHTTNGTITVNTDGTPTFTPIQGTSVVTREVEIYLIAAGGTIPLMIANGCDAVVGDDKHEVHEIFGVSGVTMVNTRGQYSTAFGSYQNGVSPKYKKYDMTSVLDGKDEGEITLNDIPVDVIWATDQFSVSASLNNNARIIEYEKDEDGKYIVDIINGKKVPRVKQVTGVATAPHMIQVDLGTDWATERRNIADCYPTFGDYVGTPSIEFWKTTTEESRFNLYEQNVTTFNKENYGDGKTALTPDYAYYTNVQTIVTGGPIWTGTEPLGGHKDLDLTIPTGGVKANQVMTFTFTHTHDQWNTGHFCAVTTDGNSIYYYPYTQGILTETVSVTLTSAMANKLNEEKKIKVYGQGMTLTSITVE